jgi:hypothetical protein
MESLKFGFAVDSPYFHAHNPSVKNNAQYGEYYIALKVFGENLECLKVVREEGQVYFEKVEIPFENIDLYFFYPGENRTSTPAAIEDLEKLLISDWRGCIEHLLENVLGRMDLYEAALELVHGIEIKPITIIVCEDNEKAEGVLWGATDYNYTSFPENEVCEITKKYSYSRNFDNDSLNMNQEIMAFKMPESELYPSKQALLADMLVELSSLKGRSIIVHTHSEYLVRKLQVLVKEGKLKPEEIAIYHINDEIKHIPLFGNGRLKQNFGRGFYDQTNQLVNQLYE